MTRRIQEGHMANIRKMAAAGKLAVAGPFAGNGDLRGVFIFQNTTLAEAREIRVPSLVRGQGYSSRSA
jgi:uncharacterized protein YciI